MEELTRDERTVLRLLRRNSNYSPAELTHIIIDHRSLGLWDYIIGEVRKFIEEEG